MKLQHIELSKLKLSTVNVRKQTAGDVSELVASIRSLGVIQPLLVRPNCEGFEVVAGQRRLLACQALHKEIGSFDPLPCAVLDNGDDAIAIEASLAENVARLPMDEIDQYEAFAALKAKGSSVEDIAAKFGITEMLVKKRLAIAGLIKPVLQAYRKGDIDVPTIRLLTMATQPQQKAWFKLYSDPEADTPTGWWLKSWLFGGQDIPVAHALFDLKDYKGAIIDDLFGEDSYFGDHEKFWKCQNEAVAARKQTYLDDGWREVVILDIGQAFSFGEHDKWPKKDGGRVYVSIRKNGAVECHEGWLTSKEATRLERAKAQLDGDTPQSLERPELTKTGQLYCDLHRHIAVRDRLLKAPDMALRLMLAHAICSSGHWDVRPETQNTNRNEAIRKSLDASGAQKAFDAEREAVKKLLGLKAKDSFMSGSTFTRPDLAAIFARLLTMKDGEVMRVLTLVMAETLSSGSTAVEILGNILAVNVMDTWQPDDAFFELLRDKEAINAMLAEVGSSTIAEGNITATAKVQKSIIRKHLNGEDGRKQPKNWMPRYMRFPMTGYTKRSGLDAANRWKDVARLFKAGK